MTPEAVCSGAIPATMKGLASCSAIAPLSRACPCAKFTEAAFAELPEIESRVTSMQVV